MRLVFSPDDGGWYWQAYDWTTSQLFATEEEARAARSAGQLVWSS